MNEPLPGLEETRRRLTDHDVVAVVLELPIGEATPVAAMRALGTEASCFLLESVEGSGAVARWSMLGHGPSRVISDTAGGEDPLAVLDRDVASIAAACAPGLAAPLLGGAVGFLTYEAAGRYERLPEAARDPLRLPHQWFAVFDTVAVFDHAQQRLLLSSCVHRDDPAGLDAAYARALSRIDALREVICSATPEPASRLAGIPVDVTAHDHEANLSRDDFQDRVRRALDYIVAGDIFQVQVSRRFALPLQADPFDVYVALRAINPSPYMIYIATPECTLVGASPEMLVQVTGQSVRYHPIAGTRRRGRTAEDDERMERELRASDKEAAEHLMLIDLGRNDLGRVCATGSVRVTQHMEVERYSHVMHLVSSIEGTLDDRSRLARCAARVLSRRHRDRSAEDPCHGDHRRARARGSGTLCRCDRLCRLRRRPRHCDRAAHDCGPRRRRIRAGRGRHRGRFVGPRGDCGDRQQGGCSDPCG